MTYYTGSITAVPVSNKEKYKAHLIAAWPLLAHYGAVRMVESWGVDVQKGRVNDLFGAVDARSDEAIVYAWIEWPDRAAADTAWQAMPNDPAMAALSMPFDGSRMIFGGFDPVLATGGNQGAGYIQGFALAVPESNRARYVDMARQAWEGAFRPRGCLGMVEAWGVDVPRGKLTDFYRATLAEDGEAPVFGWTAWPDKATCDAAARAMEAEMEGQEFPEMPFDGMRMMWGGFEVIFDTAR